MNRPPHQLKRTSWAGRKYQQSPKEICISQDKEIEDFNIVFPNQIKKSTTKELSDSQKNTLEILSPQSSQKKNFCWIFQHSITSEIPQRREKLLSNSSHDRNEVRPYRPSINQKKLAILLGRGYNPTDILGHFMSQQLDSIISFNQQAAFLGPFQYGGTTSLYIGNLTGRKTAPGRYFSGLGIWGWQTIMGRVNASLRIAIFYRPVPPDQGTSPGSVYSQHLNLFNSIRSRICPRQVFLQYLK